MASGLQTIRELTGSVNTSAFLDTNLNLAEPDVGKFGI